MTLPSYEHIQQIRDRLYDISNQRERNQISRVLTGYGFRVQKSVFECSLSPCGTTKMVEELKQLDLRSGYLYMNLSQ